MQEYDDHEEILYFRRKTLQGDNRPWSNAPGHYLLHDEQHYSELYEASYSDELETGTACLSAEQMQKLREIGNLNLAQFAETLDLDGIENGAEVFITRRKRNSKSTSDDSSMEPTSEVVYSRYSLLDPALNYLRADHLSESAGTATLDTAVVAFDSLDKQTQEAIRRELPQTDRTPAGISEEFLMEFYGSPSATASDASEDSFETESGTRIGYGHCITEIEKQQDRFQQALTETQARELLQQDLNQVARALNQQVKVYLAQAEFEAVLTMAYHLDIQSQAVQFVLHQINNLRFAEAAKAIERLSKPVAKGKAESTAFRTRKYSQKFFTRK